MVDALNPYAAPETAQKPAGSADRERNLARAYRLGMPAVFSQMALHAFYGAMEYEWLDVGGGDGLVLYALFYGTNFILSLLGGTAMGYRVGGIALGLVGAGLSLVPVVGLVVMVMLALSVNLRLRTRGCDIGVFWVTMDQFDRSANHEDATS